VYLFCNIQSGAFWGNFMRNSIKFLAISMLAFVASCESSSPEVTPNVVTNKPAVAAVPAMPPIIPTNVAPSAASESLHNLAGYFPRIGAETARGSEPVNFTTADAVSNTIDRTTLFGRGEAIDGARAYTIIAAAKSAAFKAGIDKIGTPMGRANFIQSLTNNPNWVKTIPGYDDAVNAASLALSAQFAIIENNSAIFKQKSYDLQKSSIAKTLSPKEIRLKNIEANFLSPISASSGFNGQIISGNVANQSVDVRLIAAAALYVIRADEQVLAIAKTNNASFCANDAKLDLKMCVAATKYPFEQSYCISEYYADKLGQCLHKAVNDPDELRRIKAEKAAAAAKARENHGAVKSITLDAKPTPKKK
jgi:hypothetical protein